MSLIAQVRDDVPALVQSQGDILYRSGAVEIESGSATQVDATVHDGHRPTDVALRRTKRAVKVGCTCAYFGDSGDPCKHIWAALLAAAAQGYLSRGGNGRLQV